MINIQPIEKSLKSEGTYLNVHSLFYTIQGEGPFSGMPAVFIRLAGCNLQCPSCDTEYTQGRKEIEAVVLAKMAQDLFPVTNKEQLVVITGGEPFRQNIIPLIEHLQDRDMTVQIETNGTLAPQEFLPSTVFVVCSPKTGKVAEALLPHIDAYKYVLDAESVDEDGLPIRALNHTAAPRVARPHNGFDGPVFLQPMDAKDSVVNARNLAAVKHSCMLHGFILQLQIHKLIGVE